MDTVWSSIPDVLALEIISHLDIDTRLLFGVLPRRLPKPNLKLEVPVYNVVGNGFNVAMKFTNSVYVIASKGPGHGIIHLWTFIRGNDCNWGSLFFDSNGKTCSQFFELEGN